MNDDPKRSIRLDLRNVGLGLSNALGVGRVKSQVPLGRLTTFRTGGTADWFYQTRNSYEVAHAMRVASKLELPVTLLGGGSNVLVGDGGVRGLVIRFWHGDVSEERSGVVRAEAGVTLNGLVRWMINHGMAGLESWAGTPGTVGGAVHGNAHFQGELLGDRLLRVGVCDQLGRPKEVAADELDLGYDRSRLQRTGEVVLWAEFRVGQDSVSALRAKARASLAYRKRTQPLAVPSAGCVFRNPDGEGKQSVSAGQLLDRAGLKGEAVGGATVSSLHGNFIVTNGQATSKDIRELIDTCRETVSRRLGVLLRDEIVCLGEFVRNTSGAE